MESRRVRLALQPPVFEQSHRSSSMIILPFNAVPQIINQMPIVNLRAADVKAFEDSKVKLPIQHQTPDVLIGMNHDSILNVKEVKKLPSVFRYLRLSWEKFSVVKEYPLAAATWSRTIMLELFALLIRKRIRR